MPVRKISKVFMIFLCMHIFIVQLLAQPLDMNSLVLDEELSAIRAITVTKKATFSDLCKIVLIHRDELEKYPTDESACERLAELGIFDTKSVDNIHLIPLNRGAVAKAALNLYGLEKTLLFQLTGWEWYALQNAEVMSLFEKGSNSWDEISGEELITVMDLALERATEQKTWMQPKNPYKEFGFDSYKEMDQKSKPKESAPTKDDETDDDAEPADKQ